MTTTSEQIQSLQEAPAAADLTIGYQVVPGAPRQLNPQAGKIGWAILWLLGVPLPVLLVIYLVWGR